MNYIPKSKKWFIARIGKRIYRDALGKCCATCDDVEKNGLIIYDEMHADYLAGADYSFGAEGHYCNYRDTKEIKRRRKKSPNSPTN